MSNVANNRILVIGGLHGREPLGPDLVKLLEDSPIKNVTGVIGNPEAVEHGSRYVEADLNRIFPGDPQSDTQERRRAAELLELSKDYDLVLDFHNTQAPNNNCGLIGVTADSKMDQLATTLGLNRLIVATYDCINKYVPHCLSVEVSLSSGLNDASIWYDRVAALAENGIDPTPVPIERYKFIRSISMEEKADLGPDSWRNFRQVPTKASKALNVPADTHAAFAESGLIQDRYAALLEPIT